MKLFFFVLKGLGIILVCLLVFFTVVILFLLLAPIRYQAEGSIEDPNGRDEVDFTYWKEHASVQFHFYFPFHIIQGGISWPENSEFFIKILFIPISISRLVTFLSEKSQKTKEENKEQSPKRSLRVTIDKGAEKGKSMVQRFLRSNQEKETRQQIVKDIKQIILPFLPSNWYCVGTVGWGDPSVAGTILEVEGFLLPFTEGKLWIMPEYQLYRIDVKGMAQGKAQLIYSVLPSLRLIRTIMQW